LCGQDPDQAVHAQNDLPEWYSSRLAGEMTLNDDGETEFVAAPGPCSLNRSPKHNWVEKVGGLPNYICQVARAIGRGAHSLDSAIPIAIGRIRDWSEGSGHVSAAVRGRAQAAIKEWDAKRAMAHAAGHIGSHNSNKNGSDGKKSHGLLDDPTALTTTELLRTVEPIDVSILTVEEGRPMARVASAAAVADWSTDTYQYFWDPDTDNVFRINANNVVEQFSPVTPPSPSSDQTTMANDSSAPNPSGDTTVVDGATPSDTGEPTWMPSDQDVATVQQLPAVDDPDTLQSIVGAANTADTGVSDVLPPMAGRKFRIHIVIPEGIESGDRRTFAKGALEYKEPPIPLLWQKETDDGHKGSVTVGKITKVERTGIGLGDAEGVFDTHPDAAEAARQVHERFLTGVSGDVDQFKAELSEDPNGGDEDALHINHARLVAATLVAKPAFQEATIELVAEDGDEPVITAAGGPLYPSRDWFRDPQLAELTRLTVTDDGYVCGHIGPRNVRHRGNPRWRMPDSPSNFKNFHTGTIRTKEGDTIDTGVITLTGGHADLDLDARQALAHYDDTRSAVADVVAGIDKFGTWVAGAMRPGLNDNQIRAFNAAHPSGDWRTIDGKLDLIAICQVNTPGFPVARSLVADGRPLALVAAGAAELYGEHVEMQDDSKLEARVAALESRFADQDRVEERQRREYLAEMITA
jgi:hypothetical protein